MINKTGLFSQSTPIKRCSPPLYSLIKCLTPVLFGTINLLFLKIIYKHIEHFLVYLYSIHTSFHYLIYKNNYNHQEILVRENTFIHFAKVSK